MIVMKLVIVMKLMMIMMFADADCDDMATMSWGD
jgi:hypothetical protein